MGKQAIYSVQQSKDGKVLRLCAICENDKTTSYIGADLPFHYALISGLKSFLAFVKKNCRVIVEEPMDEAELIAEYEAKYIKKIDRELPVGNYIVPLS